MEKALLFDHLANAPIESYLPLYSKKCVLFCGLDKVTQENQREPVELKEKKQICAAKHFYQREPAGSAISGSLNNVNRMVESKLLLETQH